MATKKTGDPRDHEALPEGARFVPVTGTYGTEVIVPAPLTPGKPKPEPEERWTLGPERREQQALERGDEAPGSKRGAPDPAPAAGPPPDEGREPG